MVLEIDFKFKRKSIEKMQELPNEIVLEISKYLEGIDLGRFSMVNKNVYELLENERMIEKKNFIRGCNISTASFLRSYCNIWDNHECFIRKNDPLPDYVSIDPEFNFHCVKCYERVDGLSFIKNYCKILETEFLPAFESGNIFCDFCLFGYNLRRRHKKVFYIKRQKN
jgi:hypothetical protein